MKSIRKYLKIIALVLTLILPNFCYAMGDPVVVYAFFGFGLAHIIMGCILLLSDKYKQKRLQFISLFLINVIVTWLWALKYRGPNFTFMYIGLIGAPLLTFILLHHSVPKNEQR